MDVHPPAPLLTDPDRIVLLERPLASHILSLLLSAVVATSMALTSFSIAEAAAAADIPVSLAAAVTRHFGAVVDDSGCLDVDKVAVSIGIDILSSAPVLKGSSPPHAF